MSIAKISTLAFAGLATLSVMTAFAQDAMTPPASPEEAVTMRQNLMRTNGQTLKAAGSLTGDQAVAAMQTLVDDFTNMPALFPEGSIVGDSKALPAIWENWDQFTAIIDTGRTAAEAGLAAAQSGDAAAYAESLKAIGATCGACHQQFRG